MANFAQRTKAYPDARLFEIVREAEKYAPEAVVAATAEIERRGLNDDDFAPQKVSRPFSKVGKMVTGLARPATTKKPDDVIDWADNPVQETETGRPYFQWLLLVSAAMVLIAIYSQYDYIKFHFSGQSRGVDATLIVSLLSTVLQLAVLAALWLGKRIGYQFTAGIAAYTIASFIGATIYSFRMLSEQGFSLRDIVVGSLQVESFLLLCLAIASIWLLQRNELRSKFGVSQQGLTVALAVGAGIAFIIYVGVFAVI
ncbi:hypothetical protein FUA23_20635 [Neolewinella aurantiaca]|uniref:Uncharacterized protein n=1 Tax=Neolewinella aurantiaca TaxID=2602767 RepID=A0A5C7F476_9BACT|nr:hypothetical protein [Neolewinella aurantiaca]TXF85422.1 hypothetical protein FUA23_20635 [Neolewinella aurantiaca]